MWVRGISASSSRSIFFFFNDTATTEIYTLSLHDALPICAFFIGGTEIQARASDKGARLIVQRAANFGNEIAVDLSIDGKRVAYIQRDHRYDGFVSAGRHVLTVLPMPNVDLRRPTTLRVTVRPGRTYIFTAA